jgi:hypothetical protein
VEDEKIKLTADFIRGNSSDGKFTKPEDLCLEPLSLSEKEAEEGIKALKENPQYDDIVEFQGRERRYFYSSQRMTENYAKMVFRVEEKELLRLLAETVRFESKTYPRPTDIKLFTYSPFNFTEGQIQDIIKQVSEREEYSDIQRTMASNGAMYLYSTKHLVKDHAQALTEWIEVLQFQSP